MRRKRVESAADAEEEEEEEEEHSHNESCEGNGFFACYLLASLSPRYKGHTYIGFTVNPRRRIRQHNGEIGCGAWRTKKRRPWEMVLCIYGFPTNVSALQTFGMTLPAYALASFDVGLYAPHLVRLETWTKEFGMCVTDSLWCKEADWRDFLGFPFEWAWQHPVESLAVRKAAIGFKSLSGIANKIKLAYTMLTLPSWQSMNITVNFLSTKYMKHCASCPSLPAHMKIKIGSLDELPCYNDNIDGLSGNEDYNIDEVEFDNNTSTSGSVLDVSDEFVTPDSPKNPNDRDNISETFEQNKEFEARERTFVLQEQHQPFSSTTPLAMKSSSATSLQRVEIIEEADFTIVTNKSGADFSQPEPEQSGATLAANKIRDVSSTSIVPHDAEIIDLSTPSPSCRRVMGRNKRRVSSSIGTDFIDLTNTPNFVQL